MDQQAKGANKNNKLEQQRTLWTMFQDSPDKTNYSSEMGLVRSRYTISYSVQFFAKVTFTNKSFKDSHFLSFLLFFKFVNVNILNCQAT